MNSLKALSFSTCALLASTQLGSAELTASFDIDKYYRQDSGGIPQFREGSASLSARDGNFTFTTGCADNGTGVNFPINTMRGCNIGANGVLVQGVGSTPLFYEVTGVEPAFTIEPGYNDKVGLQARPAGSTFPTNIGAVSGLPYTLFFDLDSAFVSQYNIAIYDWSRQYTSRSEMEGEIRLGTYIFKFPRRNNFKQVVQIPFELNAMIEGYKTEGVPGGFRFVNTGPFADGFAQYDPRLVNTFSWTGLVPSVVASVDVQTIALKRVQTATGPTFGNAFPPVEGIRIRQPSALQSSYTIPPGFFNFYVPGEAIDKPIPGQAIFEVQIERLTGIGFGGYSIRNFQLPVRFVNTFAGFAATSFPENSPAALTAANSDYDGDGVTNWVEWLSGTNPTKPNAPKTLSAMSFVPASAAKSDEPSGGFWQMTVDRPLSLPVGTKVGIESSTDLKNWSLITENDPQWSVIDLAVNPQIKVISKTPGLVDKRYFRVKYVATGL